MSTTPGDAPAPHPAAATPVTRRTVLASAAAQLRAAGLVPDAARLEAEVLLRHAAGLSREELFLRPEDPIDEADARVYAALVAQRAAGRPTAYLVGHREFFGIKFSVDPRVLIPRPETERLVEVVCEALGDRPAPIAADIGTGSGAIAVALARQLPALRVIATDTSAGALQVARQNAACAGVAERISWAEGPGTGTLEGRVPPGGLDAVVSNPPYIPTGEIAALPLEIRAHEPAAALDGGPDGLAVHREIVAGAVRFLRPGGVLALEVAAPGAQSRAVCALIRAAGRYGAPSIVADYAGAERVVLAVRGRDDADPRR